MAQTRVLLTDAAYQQVAVAGATTVQATSGGTVYLFVGASAPSNDDQAFRLTGTSDTFSGTTTSPTWCKAAVGAATVVVLV